MFQVKKPRFRKWIFDRIARCYWCIAPDICFLCTPVTFPDKKGKKFWRFWNNFVYWQRRSYAGDEIESFFILTSFLISFLGPHPPVFQNCSKTPLFFSLQLQINSHHCLQQRGRFLIFLKFIFLFQFPIGTRIFLFYIFLWFFDI